jgi:hypothetical protein
MIYAKPTKIKKNTTDCQNTCSHLVKPVKCRFMVFNTTFNNISQATGKLYHLLLRVECSLFVIYKADGNPRRIGDMLA